MSLYINKGVLLVPATKTVTCMCGMELPFDTREQIDQAQAHQLECIATDERGGDRVGEIAHTRKTEPLAQPRDPEVHEAIRRRGREYVTGKDKT